MYDLTGMRFGKLLVIRRVGSDKSKNATWLCRCDCGNKVVKVGINLRCGDTSSCGCYHKQVVKEHMQTHGKSKTRLYKVWAGIKSRCYNPKVDNYKYYGGRNIGMCSEWKESFEKFMEWSYQNGYDENAKPQECTIDRIDNDKDYSPENCRWVNHYEQCHNQSKNRVYTYNGVSLTMAEWARKLNINYSTLKRRIYSGMSFEKAILK